jgi:hypothetical protein
MDFETRLDRLKKSIRELSKKSLGLWRLFCLQRVQASADSSAKLGNSLSGIFEAHTVPSGRTETNISRLATSALAIAKYPTSATRIADVQIEPTTIAVHSGGKLVTSYEERGEPLGPRCCH